MEVCESASHAGPIANAAADAVGGSQPSADSGPTFGVAAPVLALEERLHVREFSRTRVFWPIPGRTLYAAGLDWAGTSRRTSAGRFRITCPNRG